MTTDSRRFRYVLQPLQQRALWQQQQVEHRLARCQHWVRRLRTELEHAENAQGELIARAGLNGGTFDPARHRAAMECVLHGMQQISQIRQRLEQAQAVRLHLLRDYQNKAVQTQMYGAHREQAQQAHLLTWQRLDQAQADGDWLARSSWQQEASHG